MLSFILRIFVKKDAYLVHFVSSQKAFRASSSISRNLASKAPEKGIIMAPGSFLSTNSLILGNLKIKCMVICCVSKTLKNQ